MKKDLGELKLDLSDFNKFGAAGATPTAHVRAAWEDGGPKTVRGGFTAPAQGKMPSGPQQVRG